MYEDLVGKKKESYLTITENGEDDVFAKNPNNYIKFFDNEKEVGVLLWNGGSLTFEGNAEESAKIFFDYLYTLNQDHVNKTLSIDKAAILPRTFEFYDPIDETDLVAIPRKELKMLMEGANTEVIELLCEARKEIVNLVNELEYYRHINENLQRQLTNIETKNIVGMFAQRIIVDDLNQFSLKGRSLVLNYPKKNELYPDPNLTYWEQWTSAWNNFVPRELKTETPLQEYELFDGDINWLMVMCENWEPDFKYVSWVDESSELVKIQSFSDMIEGQWNINSMEKSPDNKYQARFFGKPISIYPKIDNQLKNGELIAVDGITDSTTAIQTAIDYGDLICDDRKKESI
ncbi:MAG: hypothetical protein WC503_03055 [Candidatus Shapirobacteria bacterium]